MAKNTSKKDRRGVFEDRCQVHNPKNDCRTKRGPDGKLMVPLYHRGMDREELATLIERLPEELQREVLDYATYLLERKVPRPDREREANVHRGDVQIGDDFDAPLPDEFWLGS